MGDAPSRNPRDCCCADTVDHRGKQQGGSDVRKKLRYPTGGEDSEEGEEEGRKAHKHELFSGIGHPYD